MGRRRPAVVDPGPDDPGHLDALARLLGDGDPLTLVLTHGHADHAGGVGSLRALLQKTGGAVRLAGPGQLRPVRTDGGTLRPVPTPGHTRDHLAWHWEERRALFVGDLLLGEGDTTWVAGYPGCVADYLDALDRVRALDAEVLIPTHGPFLRDVDDALDRFVGHRRQRIEQVRRAVKRGEDPEPEAVLQRVYGDTVPPALLGAARESVAALMEYVREHPG